MILEHIDQNYDAAYYSGEPIVLEYQETDANGAAVALGFRVFSLSVFRAEQPSVGYGTTGTISDDSTYVTFVLGATVTRAFDTVRDGQYQIAETVVLADNTEAPVIKVAGRLSVETSAGFQPGSSATPVLSQSVTRLVRVVRGAGFRVIRTQEGAQGGPGPQGPIGPGGTYAFTPAMDFKTQLKTIVETATGPVFVKPAPGLYVWNGKTTGGGVGAMLPLFPRYPMVVDWGLTKWQIQWDVRNPDPTLRSEIDHFGGDLVAHLNVDREIFPHPFTQGVVAPGGTSTSLVVTGDPGFLPVFFDAAYCQSRTANRKTVLDRQYDEDGNASVISPIRPLGTRIQAVSANGQVNYTAIDASGAPIPHGLANNAAVTILGERGYFASDGLSGINGEGRFTINYVNETTFRLRDMAGVPVTGGGLSDPVPGVANADGTWDGPVISNGQFVYFARSTVSPVTAVAAGSPVLLTLAEDTQPGHAPMQADGGYVAVAGTGLIDTTGTALDGRQFLIKSTDTQGVWEIYADDGDTIVTVSNVSTWTGGGTVTNVAFPGTMSTVGTPVAIVCRKHGTGGVAFLGTKSFVFTGRSYSSIGVLVTGIANDNAKIELVSEGRPGALLSAGAGTVILNDLREKLDIPKLEVTGAADDALNVVYKWWRPTQWPLQDGGADYIIGDFANPNTRTAKPSAPRVGDTARVFNPAGDPFAEVLVVSYDTVTKRVVFAAGSLPAQFDPSTGWTIRPFSAIARWDVDVRGYGVGARTVVCTGAYPVIRNLVSIGNRKYAVRCNNPAAGAHATNGSFDGGMRIENAIISDGIVQKSNLSVAIQMRRFNPLTGLVAAARSSFLPSWIGNLRMDRLGYAMGQIQWPLRIDNLSYSQCGYLQGNTVGPSSVDWTIDGVPLSIGQSDGDRPLRFAFTAGGSATLGTVSPALATPQDDVTVLTGSGFVSRGTIAAGGLTVTAAKKVRVGDEGRVRVFVGGVEQDSASYAANGTAALTFVSAPVTSGGPVPYRVIHERC